MKAEEIKELFKKFEEAAQEVQGGCQVLLFCV